MSVRRSLFGRLEVAAASRLPTRGAALGAAGHEVTDRELRKLRAKAIRDEITVEQAIAADITHVEAQ